MPTESRWALPTLQLLNLFFKTYSNRIPYHQAGVRAVAFNPTLPILVSVVDEQVMTLWYLDRLLNLDPLTYACNWVRDYLNTNPEVPADEAKLCTRFLQ
jgi:hypothetical protein